MSQINEALLTLLRTTFPDPDDRGLVMLALEKERTFTVERARLLSREDLKEMGLPRGIIAEFLAALTPPAPAVPAPLDGLTTVLTRALAPKLGELELPALLDRLLDEGARNPSLVTFVDEQHPQLSRFGVVLQPGAEKKIDKDQTLAYLGQPRSYLGQRWVGQRVVRAGEVYGKKEEFNPFSLDRVLQNGVDPTTDVDFSAVDPATRNFLAWVGDKKPQLIRDDGHGLVEALAEKGFEGLKASRFGKAITEYGEACAEDPALATKYMTRLYRLPDARVEGGRGGPFEGKEAPSAVREPAESEIDWRAFSRAMLDAFPSRGALALAMQQELGVNLNTIAAEHALQFVVSDVIQWAQSRGWLGKLYVALRKANPTHAGLAAVVVSTQALVWGAETRKKLREALCAAATDQGTIRSMTSDVGVPPSSVNFAGSAESVWFSVISEAEKHAALDKLLALLRQQYPAVARRHGF